VVAPLAEHMGVVHGIRDRPVKLECFEVRDVRDQPDDGAIERSKKRLGRRSRRSPPAVGAGRRR
jgi:hypothetical protein